MKHHFHHQQKKRDKFGYRILIGCWLTLGWIWIQNPKV